MELEHRTLRIVDIWNCEFLDREKLTIEREYKVIEYCPSLSFSSANSRLLSPLVVVLPDNELTTM